MVEHEAQNNLVNNLGSKQSGNEMWLVYLVLQKKVFYQLILLKMLPGN